MYFPMYVVKARFKVGKFMSRRMFHLAAMFHHHCHSTYSTSDQPRRCPISWRCLEYRMLMVPCYLRGCSMHGSQATLKAVRVWSQHCVRATFDLWPRNAKLHCPCNPHCCQDVWVNHPWLVLVACADDVIWCLCTSEISYTLAWNVWQFKGEKRSGEVNRCFELYDFMLRYVRGICISSMAGQYASRPHRQTLLLPSWNFESSAVRFTGHWVTWKSLISF